MPAVLIQAVFDGAVNHCRKYKTLLDISSPMNNIINDQLALFNIVDIWHSLNGAGKRN